MGYLRSKRKKSEYLKDVAPIFDTMTIRSGRWYSKKDDKFCEYCDLGRIANVDFSFTPKFKIPVAYFLINKMKCYASESSHISDYSII